MNNAEWVCVYASTYEHKAEIICDILKQAEIEAIILNKQDSFYKHGEVEVYVRINEVLKAKQIVNSTEL